MKNSIRLTGTGGQGLILAGIILAEAALLDGKNAIQSQSYGPEARGGASKAEVIIADEAIHFPKVKESDYLLCMSEKAYEKYSVNMKQDSVLIIDTTFVDECENSKAAKTYAIPITELAVKATGRDLTANICALGVMSALGLVSEEALKKAILNRIPKGTEELNMKAFEAGKNAIK